MRFSTEGDLKRFRKPSEADVERTRAIAATMHERDCSLQEANSIRIDRERKEREAKVQAFTKALEETAKTLELTAAALPRHKREQFWDLPLRQALSMARHSAPRVRGRCERRPRPVRRRSSRSTRAGPSDPDEPEPAGPGAPVGDTQAELLETARAPVGGPCLELFQRPGPLERPEKGERR
jgi:hypothetical protein